MKKSEGLDVITQFSYARRMFCFESLQAIHSKSMLFDDLGLICLCENDHNEMAREMGNSIKNFLLIHFGLAWIPKPFQESAYSSLMLLIRLGIDKPEIQRACAALSDRYQDREWEDVFTDEFPNERVRALVIFPIRSELLFLNPLMTPTERKIFYFRHSKGQVLKELDEYLTPSLGVYPVDTDQSQRSSCYDSFKAKADETETAVTRFMNLEEIVYAYLLSIIGFYDFGIAQQQSCVKVPSEKTVIQALTTLVSEGDVYIHYRDNLLDIRADPPKIGLEPGEYRTPMYVL